MNQLGLRPATGRSHQNDVSAPVLARFATERQCDGCEWCGVSAPLMRARTWWPFVWSEQTRIRIGDDGEVPVGHLRHSIDASPRTTVIRCLRPDGDVVYLRHAPDQKAEPIVLLHVPVFQSRSDFVRTDLSNFVRITTPSNCGSGGALRLFTIQPRLSNCAAGVLAYCSCGNRGLPLGVELAEHPTVSSETDSGGLNQHDVIPVLK